jgi:hypothetical protein
MAKYYIYQEYTLRVILIPSYPESHVTIVVTLTVIPHPCLA